MPDMSDVFHKPQELMRRFHLGDFLSAKCCLAPGGGGHSKHTEAVRKLETDIEKLEATHQNDLECQSQSGGPSSPGMAPSEKTKAHKLSENVQKQLQVILEILKELPADEEGSENQRKAQQGKELENIIAEFIESDLPAKLLADLSMLEFEARKDVMNVWSVLLWPDQPIRVDRQALEYVKGHANVFPCLVDGYKDEEAALHCGVVLRSCLRHGELVQAFLDTGLIFDLMGVVRHRSVDISSDAFYSIREAILEHSEVSAPWLHANFTDFFRIFDELLESGEYLIERQALTLLAMMLDNSAFRSVTAEYVADDRHLQSVMNLLRGTSKAVQMDAFHVFKVFVSDQDKTPRVQQILFQNKERIIALIESMSPLKSDDDEGFPAEQQRVVAELQELSAPPKLNRVRSRSGSGVKDIPETPLKSQMTSM